jgi:hypothetical protein
MPDERSSGASREGAALKWIDVDLDLPSEVKQRLRGQGLKDGRHVLDTNDSGVSLYVEVVDGVPRSHGLQDSEGNDLETVIIMKGKKIVIEDAEPVMTICMACYPNVDGKLSCVFYPCPMVV